MRTFLYRLTANTGLLRKTCATAVYLLLSAVVSGCGSASEAYVRLPRSRPIPMDEVTYAWIGRQALAQYGYEEIIQRGVEAGFLRYPDSKRTNTQNLVGQTMADAASQAGPVFTQWAVTAAITSRLDSPAPGPADVVALGMLVVGLGSAVFVGVRVLTSSTTATAPPVPTATVVPTATATTTTTSPPIPVPRESCPPCSPYPNGTIGYLGPHIDHDHHPVGRPHLNQPFQGAIASLARERRRAVET